MSETLDEVVSYLQTNGFWDPLWTKRNIVGILKQNPVTSIDMMTQIMQLASQLEEVRQEKDFLEERRKQMEYLCACLETTSTHIILDGRRKKTNDDDVQYRTGSIDYSKDMSRQQTRRPCIGESRIVCEKDEERKLIQEEEEEEEDYHGDPTSNGISVDDDDDDDDDDGEEDEGNIKATSGRMPVRERLVRRQRKLVYGDGGKGHIKIGSKKKFETTNRSIVKSDNVNLIEMLDVLNNKVHKMQQDLNDFFLKQEFRSRFHNDADGEIMIDDGDDNNDDNNDDADNNNKRLQKRIFKQRKTHNGYQPLSRSDSRTVFPAGQTDPVDLSGLNEKLSQIDDKQDLLMLAMRESQNDLTFIMNGQHSQLGAFHQFRAKHSPCRSSFPETTNQKTETKNANANARKIELNETFHSMTGILVPNLRAEEEEGGEVQEQGQGQGQEEEDEDQRTEGKLKGLWTSKQYARTNNENLSSCDSLVKKIIFDESVILDESVADNYSMSEACEQLQEMNMF